MNITIGNHEFSQNDLLNMYKQIKQSETFKNIHDGILINAITEKSRTDEQNMILVYFYRSVHYEQKLKNCVKHYNQLSEKITIEKLEDASTVTLGGKRKTKRRRKKRRKKRRRKTKHIKK